MELIKKRGISKLAVFFFVAALIVGITQLASVPSAFADDPILTVYVDGETAASYTLAQLQDTQVFTQYTQIYSTINNWPTDKFYVAQGPSLADVLDDAGMPEDPPQTLTVTATDSTSKTFTVDELLNDTRYYYPNLTTGDTSGLIEVPTILALLSASGTNPANMTSADRIRLMMGQRYITEQSNPWQVKNIYRIDISTTAPGQWDQVTASPEPGQVTPGTEVTLSHSDIDEVKIYYTLDGSDPDITSTMYNISATYFQPELNEPIEITGTGTHTIKAIAIGPGQTASNVATFQYIIP
ncbi:MAG TPA: hypothetical protein DCZ10_15685 [Pelotomaculum sp.]|nr:hypothetical protein [Pelotomaculum sp.]